MKRLCSHIIVGVVALSSMPLLAEPVKVTGGLAVGPEVAGKELALECSLGMTELVRMKRRNEALAAYYQLVDWAEADPSGSVEIIQGWLSGLSTEQLQNSPPVGQRGSLGVVVNHGYRLQEGLQRAYVLALVPPSLNYLSEHHPNVFVGIVLTEEGLRAQMADADFGTRYLSELKEDMLIPIGMSADQIIGRARIRAYNIQSGKDEDTKLLNDNK